MVHANSNGRQSFRTLVDLLQYRAGRHRDRIAYEFCGEDGARTRLTYGELDLEARRIAASLQQLAEPGEPALLVYPPGLEFVTAFLGCAYAGLLAVPAAYPKPRRPPPRLLAIARECGARLALTTSSTLERLDLRRSAPELAELRWTATDQSPAGSAEQWRCLRLNSEDLAFLQYTSGSTSDPKGVMVSHGNLLHNLEMIRQGFDISGSDAEGPGRGVFWLPTYHDMGLIGGILEALYVGGQSILMPPAAFLQRPFRWLKAISDFAAQVSGAPNFAYDLCVERITPEQRASLDLSNWRLAFCGAEPISPDTLERFAAAFAPCGFCAESFYPCYGLAEATLLAAGGRGPGRPLVKRVSRAALASHRAKEVNGSGNGSTLDFVACGQALLGQEILIANPETRRPCKPEEVGEIWLRGRSVAQGYWNRPEESEQTFGAQLAGRANGRYLRTGDLGFISDGQLYVAGRIKDVIIIRGRNYYPQDIEQTVEQAHPALASGAGAAFSVDGGGQEQLVVVHEVRREYRTADLTAVVHRVRKAVAEEYELVVHAVVLIRPASLPRTTSGKAQRALCREQFLANQLKVLNQWRREDAAHQPGMVGGVSGGGRSSGNGAVSKNTTSTAKTLSPPQAVRASGNGASTTKQWNSHEVDRLSERVETWLLDWMVQRGGVPADMVDPDRPFAEYGLDSVTAVQMSGELEDWLHVRLEPIVAWNYPTPRTLARYLAERAGGSQTDKDDGSPAPASAAERIPSGGYERLLADIESLSDSDAEAALGNNG